MKKFRNIIFDFDGTLVDTEIDIKESLQASLNEVKGININIETLIIGPPLEDMIKTIIPEISPNELNEIISKFRLIYRNCGFNKTLCYSGIKDLLKELKKNNKQIYIATNKPLSLTMLIVNLLKINLFNDIISIDSIEGQKLSKTQMISHIINNKNLIKSETVMVGDSVYDIIAAKQNSISSVGVGYGYENQEIIINTNPDYYVNSVYKLKNILN